MFRGSHRKTQLASQLQGGGALGKSQISRSFGSCLKWIWSNSDLGIEFEEAVFPLEETRLAMISLDGRGC